MDLTNVCTRDFLDSAVIFNLFLIQIPFFFKEKSCIIEPSGTIGRGIVMEHIEMVERLHEKANISYTDAKDALERSGWDMLEALVLLEREGKIDPLTASTSSADGDTAYETVTATASKSKKDNGFHEAMNKAGETLKRLFDDSLTTDFVVKRQGKEVFRLQVLIALILCLCLWEPILIALVVGLICDCRYSINSRPAKDGETDRHE